MSTDSHETIIWDTTVYWQPHQWVLLCVIKDKLFPLKTYDRSLMALICKGTIRFWNQNLCQELIQINNGQIRYDAYGGYEVAKKELK